MRRTTVTMRGTATRQPVAIAVDTNILIHAWRKESPWHQQAAALIEGLELGTSEWAIPDPCLCEFYQAVTNPKKFQNPATPMEARGQLEFWLASTHVVVLCEFADEEEDYWACFTDILKYAQLKGLKTYSHRRNLSQHRVGELWTQDRDYSQFKKLKIRNPLV
jgi:uncharacterized protein